jgi:hypothetical protein
MPLTKCPSLGCGRVGEDIGTCGQFLSCPKREVPVDPQTDIVLKCGPCDITRTVPADLVFQGKSKLKVQCPRADCCVTVVSIKGPAEEVALAPKARSIKKA